MLRLNGSNVEKKHQENDLYERLFNVSGKGVREVKIGAFYSCSLSATETPFSKSDMSQPPI